MKSALDKNRDLVTTATKTRSIIDDLQKIINLLKFEAQVSALSILFSTMRFNIENSESFINEQTRHNANDRKKFYENI